MDVAWNNDPLYISDTSNGSFYFTNRFERNSAGNYVRNLFIENTYCRKEGLYEMRLRGEQKKNIYLYRYNDYLVSPRTEDFDLLTNWKSHGEKILLVSDPCGDQHSINLTGYQYLRFLDRSIYEYEG